jgi:flagellar protein FliO/FliZ
MPQWLTNIGSPDLHGPWLIIVAAIAALLILFFLYRFVFGHRLRVPAGGRTRQPRLGLVDAFSLDGQRQLVLVRRDNVEHLIMIGGPSDVLVESQIIRVSAPTSAASTREREIVAPVKAPPAAPAPVAAPVSPPPAPPPAERPVMPAAVAPPPPASPSAVEGPQPRILRPASAIQVEPATVLRRPEPAPKPREMAPAPKATEASSAPQRPAPPTRQDMGAVASAMMDSDLGASTVVPIKPAAAPSPTPTKAPQPQRPTLPPPIGTLASSPRSSVAASPREAPAAPAARPQPTAVVTSAVPARAPKAPDAFADLESLEAEMARLLGRDA